MTKDVEVATRTACWTASGGRIGRVGPGPPYALLRKADVLQSLKTKFEARAACGFFTIDVNAGDLYRDLGGRVVPDHPMPVVCTAMYEVHDPDTDTVLECPLHGFGPRLTIRYRLPRGKPAPVHP